MASCGNFHHFMAEQKRLLEKALAENKWFLSERSGHDVGELNAFNDFFDKHLNRVAVEFRASFCKCLCQDRHVCQLASSVDQMPSIDQIEKNVR